MKRANAVSYIDMINRFHSRYADEVTPSAGWLYMRLLHLFNVNFWDNITTSVSAIAEMMKWKRDKTKKHLEELSELGLIFICRNPEKGQSTLELSIENKCPKSGHLNDPKTAISNDPKTDIKCPKMGQSNDPKWDNQMTQIGTLNDPKTAISHIIDSKDIKDNKDIPPISPKGGMVKNPPEIFYEELKKFIANLPESVSSEIAPDRSTFESVAGVIIREWMTSGFRHRRVEVAKRHLLNQIRSRLLASNPRAPSSDLDDYSKELQQRINNL